ncbi:unnamed protein product [Mycena citricolor]|uniref:GH18 domain-containing protein n=1 Tax=Mycena citricolor TaxID=2018698 RepID=A0AAD2GWN0_9AGAR|nr:unnamed protein product [Mycena citricolor]
MIFSGFWIWTWTWILAGTFREVSAAAGATAAAANYTVAAGWYAGWHATDLPLTSVLWDKYTHMTYAFAVPTEDPAAISLADSDAQFLPQFVSAAHRNGVKAGLSIGGWGGSQFYSINLGSSANRTAFVKSVTSLVQKYGLDLIDFDWEFPATQGVGCNTISSDDPANFVLMLEELRASPSGKNLTLTAATSVTPYADANSSTIAQFVGALDWIVPMVYDLSWNWTAGSPRIQRALPSSPLDDSCYSSVPDATAGAGSTAGSGLWGLAGRGSARSAVEAWVGSGAPASKIVLGMPAYGHSFNVNASAAFVGPNSTLLSPYPAYDTLNHSIGDSWDSTGGVDQCGVYQGPGGTWDFWALVQGGYLLSNGSAAPGVPYRWDQCASVPYLYINNSGGSGSGSGGVLVTYDDPQSYTAKGTFVRANGLRGFAMWEVAGDPRGVLLDAILSAPAPTGTAVPASAAAPSASRLPTSYAATGFVVPGILFTLLLPALCTIVC